MTKEEREEQKPLNRELYDYQKHGVGLYLEGKNSRSDRICRIVAESDNYMRDYIIEDGRVQAIDFRKLSEEDRNRK